MVSVEHDYPMESPITEAPQGTLVVEMRVEDEAREYELAVRTRNEIMQYFHATQIRVLLTDLRDPQRPSSIPLNERKALADDLERQYGQIYTDALAHRAQAAKKAKQEGDEVAGRVEVHAAAA